MKKLTIALLFGGKSSEHEVSLRSASSILEAVDRHKYNVVPIGITKTGQWRSDPDFLEGELFEILQHGSPVLFPVEPMPLKHLIQCNSLTHWIGRQIQIDVVFPVLHGPFGEDGTIQGLLEIVNIPYVGSGVLGSALAMDKDVMKRLFQQDGLRTTPFIAFRKSDWGRQHQEIVKEVTDKLGYPCFVKPANLGSSIGISKVEQPKQLNGAISLAVQFDNKVIVEKALDAREIECSVLGNVAPQASVPGEITPGSVFYDYQAKYLNNKAQLLIPAPLKPVQVKQIQELAVRSFQVAECQGMARVDFFLDRSTEEIFVNEINTIPGFTSISMYPKLWKASGISYSELIDRLIELAIERHHQRQSKSVDGG